jgi:hypothetical protein
VAYSEDLFFYPADLNFIGTTEAEYFRKIDEAVATGWSFEKMRKTFRWLSLVFSASTVDIRGGEKTLPRRLIQRALRTLGRRTRFAFFSTWADRLVIDDARLDADGLRRIEETLEGRLLSLADTKNSRAAGRVSEEQEAAWIREEMEGLFRGVPSKVVSNLRKHFAAQDAAAAQNRR